jgi:hypothetical protein
VGSVGGGVLGVGKLVRRSFLGGFKKEASAGIYCL